MGTALEVVGPSQVAGAGTAPPARLAGCPPAQGHAEGQTHTSPAGTTSSLQQSICWHFLSRVLEGKLSCCIHLHFPEFWWYEGFSGWCHLQGGHGSHTQMCCLSPATPGAEECRQCDLWKVFGRRKSDPADVNSSFSVCRMPGEP